MSFLWFAPYAGLWPSFRMEHRLAEQLARSGDSVTMVHCRGLFNSYCPVMAADRVSTNSSFLVKRQVCTNCKSNSDMTSTAASYNTVYLEDFLEAQDRARAQEMTEELTHENWMDFELDGIPLGRYATYISLLQHKLPDVTKSNLAWSEYKAEFHNALLTSKIVPRILHKFSPDYAVVYNPLYPANRVFSIYAQRAGARLVGLSAGGFVPSRYETVALYPHVSSSQTLVESRVIASGLKDSLSEIEIMAVGKHLESLIMATDPWIYSSSLSRISHEETMAKLGIDHAEKVVVVLLSSPDETRASVMVDAEFERNGISGQPDIVQYIELVRSAAEAMPDVHFVFRVHPRLYPNKRENVISPDAERILDALENLPANASINHPDQNISLYELISFTSVAVNQSSSAGLEFLSLGVPVVHCDPEIQGIYPPDFGFSVQSHDSESLVSEIRSAIKSGANIAYSISAFRWYAVTLLRALLPLSDVFVDPHKPACENLESSLQVKPRIDLNPLKKVIPRKLREYGAKRIDRRNRRFDVPDPVADGSWVIELRQRIDTLGSGPVWEPLLFQRGNSLGDLERKRLTAKVNELRRMIGAQPLN